MKTILTKHQTITEAREFTDKHEGPCIISTDIRHDDRCNNGHNTFSITGQITTARGREVMGGCIHEDIAKHFPEYAPFIKWHLCSTDGPLHYEANTLYHAQTGKYDYARSTAIWPKATKRSLKAKNLKSKLAERLPGLLKEFKGAVESLGFTY